MQLAIIENGIIKTIDEDSILFPNTSFPMNFVDEDFLMANSAMQVIRWEMFDSSLEKSIDTEPYIRDGKVYTFRIEPKSETDLAEEANQARLSKENEVRTERNNLLLASDWTQVADAPVDKTAWATYRQELRDITSQEGFPFNVVFPTPPL